MKRIVVYVPESSVMSTVTGPRYLFTTANQILSDSLKNPLFEVIMTGLQHEVQVLEGMYTVKVDKLLHEVTRPDLIIIPALFGDIGTAIERNRDVIPWIRKHYDQGTEVASLCVGAFLLASTGLLNGRQCSTHWAYAGEFRSMFPEVDLADGRIITESGRIYSSGGANSFWNLLLYLLEKYTDRQTSILASKYFAIDIDRNSQDAFTIFRGQKDHRDEEVKRAQEYIEHHFADRFSVDHLASELALSRRSLERRFKKATRNTLIEYIQRVKVEAAKRQFEGSNKTITEIMYDVGYTDSKSFRTVFRKITGLTPAEYRNKFGKNMTQHFVSDRLAIGV